MFQLQVNTFLRNQDDITITVTAPMYWWDEFSQITDITPVLHPLILSVNPEELFPSFEDVGLIRMMKDAIEQAQTEYMINPTPETERRFCELIPYSIQRKGNIHIKEHQLKRLVDCPISYDKNGDDWKIFTQAIRAKMRR